MSSPFTFACKFFAKIAACALITSFTYEINKNDNMVARTNIVKTRCEKAYDNNEILSEIVKACQKDDTVAKYEDIEGFLVVTFLVAGMTALCFIRNPKQIT